MPIGPPTKQYVRPHALDNQAAQGQFYYRPKIVLLEDATLAGLQSQLESEVEANNQDPYLYWVVKDVQYQTVYKPPKVSYSLCVHLEIAENL